MKENFKDFDYGSLILPCTVQVQCGKDLKNTDVATMYEFNEEENSALIKWQCRNHKETVDLDKVIPVELLCSENNPDHNQKRDLRNKKTKSTNNPKTVTVQRVNKNTKKVQVKATKGSKQHKKKGKRMNHLLVILRMKLYPKLDLK